MGETAMPAIQDLAAPEADGLAALRRDAWRRWTERGLPGPKDPAWRGTSLKPLTETQWTPAPAVSCSGEDLRPHIVEGSHRIVCVDGRPLPGLSSLADLPEGVHAAPLRDHLEDPDVQQHLGHVLDARPHVLAELNTAAFQDGVLLRLEEGVHLDAPIHLLHATTGAQEDTVHHPRTLALLGRGASCTIIEHHVGLHATSSWSNPVTELLLGDEASLHHIRLDEEGPGTLHTAGWAARLGRNARLRTLHASIGSSLHRTTAQVHLGGEGAEADMDGMYLVGGAQHHDHHTRIDHAVPHTTSRQLYKGVLAGAARAVFTGNIVVHPRAAKSSSDQQNRNLILGRKALVDTTPQLEILNDDVTCSHGSTVGRLDPDALLYLRSRGVGLDRARLMLVESFCHELSARAGNDWARQRLEQRTAQWFQDAGEAP